MSWLIRRSKVGQWSKALLIPAVLVTLSGCGGSIMPDRHKEYQYSSEIPPLEVPPDLSPLAIEQSDAKQQQQLADEIRETQDQLQLASRPLDESGSVSLIEHGDAPAHLEIYDSYPVAWRQVERALTRLELEITDRDRSIGFFYVLFADPEAPREEDGVWSTLAFWKSFSPEEIEYRIKLEDRQGTSDLYVLDDTGKPQSEGSALRLLKKIEEKIENPNPEEESAEVERSSSENEELVNDE